MLCMTDTRRRELAVQKFHLKKNIIKIIFLTSFTNIKCIGVKVRNPNSTKTLVKACY